MVNVRVEVEVRVRVRVRASARARARARARVSAGSMQLCCDSARHGESRVEVQQESASPWYG